jgi:proteic killer suppression protein
VGNWKRLATGGREIVARPMILSFGDKETEKLWIAERSRRYGNIARVALRKLLQLHAAENLGDLSVPPPGNQLEALSGERKGQHSIRINDQ